MEIERHYWSWGKFCVNNSIIYQWIHLDATFYMLYQDLQLNAFATNSSTSSCCQIFYCKEQIRLPFCSLLNEFTMLVLYRGFLHDDVYFYVGVWLAALDRNVITLCFWQDKDFFFSNVCVCRWGHHLSHRMNKLKWVTAEICHSHNTTVSVWTAWDDVMGYIWVNILWAG